MKAFSRLEVYSISMQIKAPLVPTEINKLEKQKTKRQRARNVRKRKFPCLSFFKVHALIE